MKLKIQRMYSQHQKKVRFLLAGAVNTFIGLATYPLIYLILNPWNIGYIQVLVLAQFICITFSFVNNKYFVFRTKGNLKNEYIKFFTFHGVYFLINLICLPLLVELLKLNPMIAQTLFSVAIVVSSYFWHNSITFKSINAGTK